MSTNSTAATPPARSTPSTLILTIDLSGCVLPADFNSIAALVGGFVEGTRQIMNKQLPGAKGALSMGEHTDWLLQRFYAQLTAEAHQQSEAIAAGALTSSSTTLPVPQRSPGQ